MITDSRSVESSLLGEFIKENLPHDPKNPIVESIYQIISLSVIDDLTGTYNRRGLSKGFKIIEKAFENKKLHRAALIYFDIDDFKAIQDLPNYGHEWGDEALKNFSAVLETSVRPTDLVARVGGDEFCILVPNATDETIKIILPRIFSQLKSNPTTFNNKKTRLHTTWGVAFASNKDELTDLLLRAQHKMEKEKRDRNRGR